MLLGRAAPPATCGSHAPVASCSSSSSSNCSSSSVLAPRLCWRRVHTEAHKSSRSLAVASIAHRRSLEPWFSPGKAPRRPRERLQAVHHYQESEALRSRDEPETDAAAAEGSGTGATNGAAEVKSLAGGANSSSSSSSSNGAAGGAPAAAAVDKIPDDRPWQRRWSIISLCFVAFMLCNMDRVNMSIAVLPMAQEYGWTSFTVGLVQSSFFWGYLLTQVLGGVWADKFGGKRVLGFGVVWWSLATMLTPLAARAGLPVLLLARACMGVGEGVAMPAMNNLLSRWVPVQERSRSLALVYSGMYTGSIVGLAASPQMIASLGWPSVFYIFGVIGLAWYVVWVLRAHSGPTEDPRISNAERAFIVENTTTQAPARDIPWRLLLSKPAVWALILSHFCHNWGTFILLTWMPMYYNQVLGFDLMTSGFFSVLPWVTMAISANVGGWIADTLITRGTSITLVRKIMQTIGFLGPAFFLTQLSGVSSAQGAVLCMMASQGLDAFSQSGLYSNHQDIGPRYAGVLLGMSNTAGVLAGVMGTAATGWILQHGSWNDVWGVSVALYLVGTVIWNLFATGEQVID